MKYFHDWKNYINFQWSILGRSGILKTSNEHLHERSDLCAAFYGQCFPG